MDQINALLVPIGSFLLLGLLFIAAGLYLCFRGMPLSETRWRKDLLAWHVIDPNAQAQTQQIQTEVKRGWDTLLSMLLLAAGSAVILLMGVWTIIALATGNAALDSNNSAFFVASVMLSLSIGLGVGAELATRLLRRAARRIGLAYAHLQPRRLSDYRSTVFYLLVAALLIWTAWTLWFFAPHIGSTSTIDLFYAVVPIPNTLLDLSIVPGMLLLFFLLLESVLWSIVRLPRLLVISDATVSQQANDMVRAWILGGGAYCELLALSQLAAMPYNLIVQRLWATHYWQIGHRPYSGLLTISSLIPLLILILGFSILLLRGHLGGRIARWPWQTKSSDQPSEELTSSPQR